MIEIERVCSNCANKFAEDPCACLECDCETLNNFLESRDAKIYLLRHAMTEADLWGQLEEEAAELAQAASKMRRLSSINLPRKTREECILAVAEEHADLALCFEVLDWHDKSMRRKFQEDKLDRWVDCIRENLRKKESSNLDAAARNAEGG